MSGQMTGQHPFEGLAKVVQQMEPISTLNCLRSPCCCRRSIISSTISTYQFNFWMCSHPSGSRFHLSVGQQIDSLVALHVDQDGSKPTTTPEGEVINTKLGNGSNGSGWKRHHPAQKRHPRSLYPKPLP